MSVTRQFSYYGSQWLPSTVLTSNIP